MNRDFPPAARVVVGVLLISLAAAGPLRADGPMFDPAMDRPGEEWCYAAQSTTVIGMPFVPAPVQVTYDGAIYTRYAELAFLQERKASF